MLHRFKIGDKVGWHIEFGPASGTIIRVLTRDTEYNGQIRHCSEADPQYEIRSLKTDHMAMHKGPALHHLK
jgi:hypothetical protein